MAPLELDGEKLGIVRLIDAFHHHCCCFSMSLGYCVLTAFDGWLVFAVIAVLGFSGACQNTPNVRRESVWSLGELRIMSAARHQQGKSGQSEIARNCNPGCVRLLSCELH